MKLLLKLLVRAALATAVTSFGLSAFAQGYPDRPVRFVIPFPASGPTDIIGRLIAERLTDILGRQFIVENHGGANGVIGTNIVAKARPDGYTLLLTASGPLASGLALYKDVPYDPVRDFTPITIMAKSDIVLVASPYFPAKSFQEFISAAKTKPNEVSAELNTIGSMHHLLTALLSLRTNTKLLLVPYKGSGPAIVDLLGGHVNVGFESVPGVISYIRSNRLRAYAVASDERLKSLPDVPTLKELGQPELVAEPWFAVLAPAGTPKEVIDKLSAALAKVAQAQKIMDQFAALGMIPVWKSPDDTTRFLSLEVARWAAIVKETGAKME
jgi:tripartite-type tricarboxylate transporter receptor subunit TctC